MIKAIKNFWKRFEVMTEENRRREAERKQMLRDNLAAWNELNKDFIKKMDREVEKEINKRYDVSHVPEPTAFNIDGSPVRR